MKMDTIPAVRRRLGHQRVGHAQDPLPLRELGPHVAEEVIDLVQERHHRLLRLLVLGLGLGRRTREVVPRARDKLGRPIGR